MLDLGNFSVCSRDHRFRGRESHDVFNFRPSINLALVGMMDWTRMRKALICGWRQGALSLSVRDRNEEEGMDHRNYLMLGRAGCLGWL